MQSQKAVSAHFTSKQILPFGFAEQYISPHHTYTRKHHPANTKTDVRLILVHSLRRWHNNNLTLGKCLVFVWGQARALVLWLKLSAWKIGDRGLEPHSGLQASKNQNVSSLHTRKDAILWGASVTERTRILNPVSGGQCHLIHLTILRSLAYMCLKPPSFHFVGELRFSWLN